MFYFVPANNYTDYTVNCSGLVSNDLIMLRITAAIPDKVVVLIVLQKTAYFMGNDLIQRTQIFHDHSNFVYNTPEVGGSHVALVPGDV